MQKQSVTVLAPAKLNLSLDVRGLLPNGYHDLDMVMQAITLREQLTLRRSETLTVRMPGSFVPVNDKNGAKETPAICALLNSHGALTSQMTGSGAAVFGVFDDEAKAKAARAALQKQYKKVYLAQPDRGGARVIYTRPARPRPAAR